MKKKTDDAEIQESIDSEEEQEMHMEEIGEETASVEDGAGEKTVKKEEKKTGHRAEKKASQKKSGKKSKGRPELVNYEKEEVEKLIIKLGQSGKTWSEIGLILSKQYGIPDVKSFGITIGKLMEKSGKKQEIPEDLYNLMKKAVIMSTHLGKNKKDKKGVHRLQLIESRVRKLGRYYSSIGKLPKDWKYDINKAKLIMK